MKARKYNPHQIEQKWQNIWPKEWESYKLQPGEEKYYCLDMWSYPSSDGLHTGHWRPYTIADAWARYQTLKGKKVLHPVGFDAFGLPAENAAIKNKTHPADYTKTSIANFTRQLHELGAMYDWSTHSVSSSPDYYRWTQWLFLQLYNNDLAYRKSALVNWCPKDQTVLANEQVIGGRCERCGTEVNKKELKQWFFKITDFAEDLLNFDGLTWPERVKTLQRAWIGKSEGAEIDFPITESNEKIKVFTTRPDTLMGVTYLVLAPEHPFVKLITSESQKNIVTAYQEQALKESEIERLTENRKKTGVFTGAYAKHPLTDKDIPIWVADYVLGTYGTGAVMGVPAHDSRDFIFARDYKLPIAYVISPPEGVVNDDAPYLEPGTMINSDDFNDQTNEAGGKAIVEALEKKGSGKWTVQYRLRDWLVSRQRYWGAPIPIIYCEKCGEQAVPESDLPVLLPTDVEFMPTGGSPLDRHPTFKHTSCPNCGGSATRETDTLDTFVDSSWYFLRYTDPKNDKEPFSKEQVEKWLPVDFYVGGVEHAILHLLYARFVTKALQRLNYVSFHEPFKQFYGNGIVYLHGSKMSKSKGNIVNPDDIVKRHGTDALRGYILFMGPGDQDVEWQENGILGVRRFMDKSWQIFHNVEIDSNNETVRPPIEKAYQAISDLLPHLYFNRCISTLMTAANELQDVRLNKHEAEILAIILSPFMPHLAEEVWSILGHSTSIFDAQWPVIEVAAEKTVIYAIQVNGKLRGTLEADREADESKIINESKRLLHAKSQLDENNIIKTIFVAGRIVNFVVK
jgi:leucyl-tRNA synthetase